MPLPVADNGSPQSTNEWGDPTDGSSDVSQDAFPHEPSDSLTPESILSYSQEPKHFRQLQPGDQRFMKQLDSDAAKLQFSGEYLGVAAGVVVGAVLRSRRGLSLMPFARLLEQTPANSFPNASMDYVNGGLIGSIVGRLVSGTYGWSSLDKRLDAEPAIAARIRNAMGAKENKEAFRKYRNAWYEAQQGLTIPQKFWYRFSYTSC